MLLSQLCTELELKEDDARMILADVRDDFADCEDVTNEEAKLIRNSIKAALPGGTGEVPLEPGLEVSTQRTLVSNVSQVLGIPLFLAIEAELNAIATIEDVKNHLILNTLDQKQAELDQAIRKRSASRQQGYYTALKDLAHTMQKPLVVVEDMQQDIQSQNQKLEELLVAVKAGESLSPETAIS
ncbi:MAG: hypothetical protein AAF349_02000 [Cyanobacteria bacterium P01_A01_bin.68]